MATMARAAMMLSIDDFADPAADALFGNAWKD